MSHHRKSIEFIGVIGDDGRLSVPPEILGQVDGRVHVRLGPVHQSSLLREKGVSEEEVDHIGAVQLESREQVVKFLLSEGVLNNTSSFSKRARAFVKSKAE